MADHEQSQEQRQNFFIPVDQDVKLSHGLAYLVSIGVADVHPDT